MITEIKGSDLPLEANMKKFMIGYRWLDEKQTFEPQHYVVGYGSDACDAINRFVANCGDLGISVYTAEPLE